MSDNGFMPQNLSVFGRASLLVVLIELLWATTGLIHSVTQLVHYERQDKSRDSVYLFLAIFFITLSALFFIFNILLYAGVRKGRVRWLRVWYKFGIFILMLAGAGVITSAIADEDDGIKSPGDISFLIIRVFEIWVVYEYCKELERGYTPQTDSVA